MILILFDRSALKIAQNWKNTHAYPLIYQLLKIV